MKFKFVNILCFAVVINTEFKCVCNYAFNTTDNQIYILSFITFIGYFIHFVTTQNYAHILLICTNASLKYLLKKYLKCITLAHCIRNKRIQFGLRRYLT